MLNQIISQMGEIVEIGDIMSVGTDGREYWAVDDDGWYYDIDRTTYFQVLLATSDTADLDATLEAASVYGQRQ